MLRASRLLFIVLSMVSLLAVSCTENPDPATVNLTITASVDKKTAVGQEITFDVKVDGKDASENEDIKMWCVSDADGLKGFGGFRYTPATAGIYKFFAELNSDGVKHTSLPIIITASEVSFILSASSEQNSAITFTVTVNDKLVSASDSKLELYAVSGGETTPLESLEYTITDDTECSFYATYPALGGDDNFKSNTITINGATSFDDINYVKRALGIQHTGTWCGYCPVMTSGIYHYEKANGDDNAVFTAAHYNDGMANPYSTYVGTKMSVTGWPSLYIGSVRAAKATFVTSETGGYSVAVSKITAAIEKIQSNDAATAIEMISVGNDDKFAINATIAINKDGKYGVGAMILEDDIEANQTIDITLKNLDLEGYNLNIHENAIQAYYPKTSYLYEVIGGLDEHKAGSAHYFSCGFDTSSMTTLSEIDNCSAVVFTFDIATGLVDNVVKAPINTKRNFDSNN